MIYCAKGLTAEHCPNEASWLLTMRTETGMVYKYGACELHKVNNNFPGFQVDFAPVVQSDEH